VRCAVTRCTWAPVPSARPGGAGPADQPDQRGRGVKSGRLVDELRAADPRVEDWWDAHDVAQKSHGAKHDRHPQVGDLTLHDEALILADDGDQILTIYAAEPGSTDGERLAALSSGGVRGAGVP
jgi:MmyB-like transcription regulator ligand binding domain